jgi:hypothetical protein
MDVGVQASVKRLAALGHSDLDPTEAARVVRDALVSSGGRANAGLP